MSLRYLRRPPKSSPRNLAAARMKREGSVKDASGSAEVPVDIAPDECLALAKALAYFCAACGREHASGDVRCNDVVSAEADIVAVIRGAQ